MSIFRCVDCDGSRDSDRDDGCAEAFPGSSDIVCGPCMEAREDDPATPEARAQGQVGKPGLRGRFVWTGVEGRTGRYACGPKLSDCVQHPNPGNAFVVWKCGRCGDEEWL